MQYSDDDPQPRPSGDEHDDLVGPRRGRPSGSSGDAQASGAWERAEGDDDLTGPRRRSRFTLEGEGADEAPPPRRELRPRARRGEDDPGQLVLSIIRELPHFLRLLTGLARDRRVSMVDKALVGVAIAYFFVPEDAIPDFAYPFLGQLDDLVVMGVALGRLLSNAGSEVLLDHWRGDVETLEAAMSVLQRANDALPDTVRNLIGNR